MHLFSSKLEEMFSVQVVLYDGIHHLQQLPVKECDKSTRILALL